MNTVFHPKVQPENIDPVMELLQELEPYAGVVQKDGLRVPSTTIHGANGPVIFIDTRDGWGSRGGAAEEPRRLAWLEVMSHTKHVFVIPFIEETRRWRPLLYDDLPAIITRCWEGGVVFLLTTVKSARGWAETAALRARSGATVEYLSSNGIFSVSRRDQ